MFTRETAIETVKDFVQSCKAEHIEFTNVILFGSTVRNQANEDSDIDVLLVSDQFSFSRWENAKLIARIHKRFSFIDAHTFPTKYFRKGDPFINEIKRTGLEIN